MAVRGKNSWDQDDRQYRAPKSIPPNPKRYSEIVTLAEDDDIIYSVILEGHERRFELTRCYGKKHTQHVLDTYRVREGEKISAVGLYRLSDTDYLKKTKYGERWGVSADGKLGVIRAKENPSIDGEYCPRCEIEHYGNCLEKLLKNKEYLPRGI